MQGKRYLAQVILWTCCLWLFPQAVFSAPGNPGVASPTQAGPTVKPEPKFTPEGYIKLDFRLRRNMKSTA